MQKLKGLIDDVCKYVCVVQKLNIFPFNSEFENWEFWKPKEFRKKYLAGTLEKFDFVFTYSSVEHSGLGTLNVNFTHCQRCVNM